MMNTRFVPYGKLAPRLRRELDRRRRVTWEGSPVTRRCKSRRAHDRAAVKRSAGQHAYMK